MIGKTLGPYRIESRLGEGGMGEVYRARDTRLDRQVALKLLPAGVATDPAALARFEREARAVAALSHPNILAIHDFGQIGTSTYAVMELLEGQSLRDRLAEGRLPTRKSVEIAAQIARGVAAAHDRGIVHRDLKPDNVFVTTDGLVKVLDFGLARSVALGAGQLADSPTLAPSTEPGVVLGTVGYMAPEQVRGEAVDHRTDIFALGCMVYEMLAGRRPFQRDTAPETMTAILRDDPPEPADRLPPMLLRTLRRCLEKRPDERFQSARDLAFALDASLDASSRSNEVAALTSGTRRSSLAVATLVVGLLLGMLAGGLAVRSFGPETDAAAPPTFRRLTFERGTVRSARFAPDGRTVIYGAAWDGRPVRIFLTRTDAPETVPLALPDAHVLAVSSQGELAVSLGHAFEGWVGSGSLARSSLLGGSPRLLLDDVREADWSPDGAELAVVRRVEGLERLEFPIGRVLYQTSGYISHIRLSPDGRRVAFADHPLFADNAGRVAMVDLTGEKTDLTGDWPSLTGLAWRSDDEIWFSAARVTNTSGGAVGAFDLYAVRPGESPRSLLAAPTPLRLYDVAADGRALLAYEQSERRVEARLAGESEARDVSLRGDSDGHWIAPDGRSIVLSDQAAAEYAAYVLHAGASVPVRLGHGNGAGISDDGRWLAALSMGDGRVLLHPTGAGESRELPNPDRVQFDMVAWLPDGRLVGVGQQPGERARGYLQDIIGGSPKPFTPEGVSLVRWWTLPVSPDGTRVVVRMPDGVIAEHPIAGEGPRPVPGLREGDVPVAWSNDPGVIFVAHGGGLPWTVERLELGTGRRTPTAEIRAYEQAGLRLSTLALARDGRHYVHSYARLLSALTIAEGLR